MSLLLIIIIGAGLGYLAFKTSSVGFGLWWDIYLGIAGSVFAKCFAILAYFLWGALSRQSAIGINLYSIIIATAGALTAIYSVSLFNKINSIARSKLNNFASKQEHEQAQLKYYALGLLSKQKN